MNTMRRVLPLALVLMAAGPPARGQTAAPAVSSATDQTQKHPTNVKKEMEKLLAADAEAIAAANKKRAGAGDQSTADAEMIDPYLKRNPKSPIAGIQIYETPLARFLRTGTILRHVGKKVNVELDVGDEGSTDVSDEGNNKAGYGEPSIALRFTW